MIRPIKRIRAGSTVYVRIEVRDLADAMNDLYTPQSAPKMRLRDATGAIVVLTGTLDAFGFATMTALTTGVYYYSHQTDITDPLGIWQVEFKIQNVGNTAYTVPEDLFELTTVSGVA